jgi:hypothetical protein
LWVRATSPHLLRLFQLHMPCSARNLSTVKRVGYCSNLSWLCLIIRALVTLYRNIVVSLLLVISTILLFTYISDLYNADGVCFCCDHVGQRYGHSSSEQLMPILYMIVSFVSVWCPCYSKHKFNWIWIL